MKKFKYLAFASIFALGLVSCGDFDDTNIDPEHLNEGNLPTEYLFTNAQHQALGSDWDMWRTGCIYSAQWIQHLTSIDWWPYYGRYEYSDGYSASFWDTFSGDRGAMRDITTCYDKWQGEEGLEVDWNMARVMRIYAFAKMSDLYGDIPYSQAGRPSQYSYPVYDKQEDIYRSMLAELDEAQANLSGTAKMGKQDVYFQGDASKWKKFANSLMLRLAMRLVKVDEATAKTYAQKALANGLLESNDDNVKLNHPGGVTTNDSAEPFAKINAHEDKEFFLSKTFVDILKSTNDPRISLLGTVCDDPSISVQSPDFQYGNCDPAIQEGLPSGGYSNSPSSEFFIGQVDTRFNNDEFLANYASKFSVPNRYTYSDPEAPTFIITYAQTQLLLAEAAFRGYIDGDAKTYFENGIRAAMAQFSQFPKATALVNAYLTATAVNEYVNSELANFEGNELDKINTQYWINTFGDPHEAFANWRRSDFPKLTASPYAGYKESKSTIIPRRFCYPQTESQVNSTNYNEAVNRLGSNGDRFDSRMWWDR